VRSPLLGLRQRRARSRGIAAAMGASATGAVALGALAMGAVAIGGLAIAALAIRSLAVERARIGVLEIDELHVRSARGLPDPGTLR
jgi:hypothetical protein